MSRKNMSRSDWKRVTERKEVVRDFTLNGERGKMSLIRILKASAPLRKDYGDFSVVVVDEGYSWVQAALSGGYVWFTAMFDENDRLVQIYADLTDGNVTDAEDPYFEDMFLDYVLVNGAVIELDRDELDDALRDGAISPEQYERTLAEGTKLAGYLQTNGGEVKRFFENALRELAEQLA